VGKTVVDAPETNERINAPLPVVHLFPRGFHNLERAFEELSWMMSCSGKSVGDIVPADDAGVEKPLRLNSVLPTGATIAQLSNKIRGAAGNKVQISKLRGSALLYFIQGTKNGDGMYVKL